MAEAPSELLSQENRLALLYRVSREISGRLDLAEMLPRLVQETADTIQAHTGSIIVFDVRDGIAYSAVLMEGRLQLDPDKTLANILDKGLAGWVVEHRQPALVTNTLADARWLKRPDDEIMGARSAVCAPLLGRERVVGVMTMVKPQAGSLDEGDLALLTAIAEQAGIAIENAQLFSAEQRRREISNILREVARIINATLELEKVLPLVLEQLSRVVAYDSASILLKEDDRLHIRAVRGFPDSDAVLALSFDGRSGPSSRVARERRAIILSDVRNAVDWLPADGVAAASNIRAWIGAPLVVQDEAIGVLCVDSHAPGVYTEEDGQVVTTFAEQAAIAVVNARLFAASQRRLQALQAQAEASQAINATLQLDEVLSLIVTHAARLFEVEAASVGLIQGDNLVYRGAVGEAAHLIRGKAIKLTQGIAGWVASHNEPALVPDVNQDPRFFKAVDRQTGFVTRAIASVPIRIRDQVIGVIEVLNPIHGAFLPETLDLMANLGSLAGTAIVHAQWVQDLQAAESRFAGLFEDSIDPILITDLDGVITDANRRAVEFFGYDRADLVDQRITAVHRMGTGWLGSDRFRVLREGQPINYQTRITTRDGNEVPVEVHAKLIQRRGQQFIQWLQHDISERLALEEMRNDMISMIVHDLRSPLGNIVSALEVVQASLEPESEMEHSLLSIANRSAGRLSRLVDSLLDLRRLEAGQVMLNREQTNVNTLVAEAVEQVYAAAESKGVQVRFEIPPRLPYINIDADMIRRVIINLLENAIKYMGGSGTVTVVAKADPENVHVSVRDTGPGIARTEHTRIFNRFTRIPQAGAPKGVGLGLAFCKLAVEAHGGRIWVESQPSKGATFSFSLPFGE